MKSETYNYLFDNACLGAIQDVLKSIPSEIQSEYHFEYSKKLEEKIFKEYDSNRIMVRERYFEIGENGQNLIYIHKVCACFTAAMVKVRIFDYDKKDVVPPELFYSNYTVAFLTGMYIMYLSMLSEYDKLNKKELFDLLSGKKTLFFPETNEGHDSYLQGRIKTLALNDMYGVDFDLLTYADMLYWIEEYNKNLLLQEIQCKGKKNSQ